VDEGPKLEHAFKTPSLRGAATRMPFMHAGQFASVQDVIIHYDRARRAPLGRTELRPLHLSATERLQLAAFLNSLDDAPGATAMAQEAR
jgi:cytochrome c peroxidase